MLTRVRLQVHTHIYLVVVPVACSQDRGKRRLETTPSSPQRNRYALAPAVPFGHHCRHCRPAAVVPAKTPATGQRSIRCPAALSSHTHARARATHLNTTRTVRRPSWNFSLAVKKGVSKANTSIHIYIYLLNYAVQRPGIKLRAEKRRAPVAPRPFRKKVIHRSGKFVGFGIVHANGHEPREDVDGPQTNSDFVFNCISANLSVGRAS